MRPLMFALMLLLAGCTAPAATDVAVEEAAAPGPASPTPLEGTEDFGWMLTAGAPGRSPEAGLMSRNGATFEVPEGSTKLDVEVAWTCTSPTCDLTIDLWAPGTLQDFMDLLAAQPTASAQGSGDASLEVHDPAPGEWLVVAHSDGATVEVSGTFTWIVA